MADTPTTKLKAKQKRNKSSPRLSFGTDDLLSDGDAFKVKKSSLSQKRMLHSNSSTPGSAPENLSQTSSLTHPTGPSYTKAYLNELKASTPSTPAVRPPVPQSDLDASFDVPPDTSPRRGHPSATSTEDDFISLSVVRQEDMAPGPHPESRLMREEDEFGEGDDDMAQYTGALERIALGKKARKDEEKKRRLNMIEMIENVEDDDESSEWEREQIRRAAPVDADIQKSLKAPKATYKPALVPAVTPLPSLASSVARLTGTLTTLTSSHASHLTSISSLGDEQSTLDSKEADLRLMIEKAERKRGWFVAFRAWVEAVASFLDEKYPSLEMLEEEHVSLLSERRDMISKRRRLDDEDDIILFLGLPPSVSTSEPENPDDAGQSDSSHRTTRAMRATRRSERSNRRLLRRARNQTTHAQEEEGYSTDGSLPSADAEDLRTAISGLEERKNRVLSDVRVEDFRDPQLGLAKWFGEWREMYEESYVVAWGGLGLVAAWEFWSRLEMVGWDPMEDDSRGLDSFEWSIALHEYSRPRIEDSTDPADEPDIGPNEDMVSSMISQAVIPRLCKIIDGGTFDPYSTSHVRRMVNIAEQIETSVGQDHVRYQMLLKSISTVFREAVTSTKTLLVPSLESGHAAFDPQSIPARRRFLVRRLKLLTNLVKWRKYAGERVELGEVATLLVRTCMLPVAMGGWDVGGGEILRKAVEIMPAELVPVEVTKRLQA